MLEKAKGYGYKKVGIKIFRHPVYLCFYLLMLSACLLVRIVDMEISLLPIPRIEASFHCGPRNLIFPDTVLPYVFKTPPLPKDQPLYKSSHTFDHDHEITFLYAREKTDAVQQEINLCGYFVIITSKKMTAGEALELYKSRDASEKLFRGDKSYLGNKSLRVQSDEAAGAKILIEFIALIVRCRIYTLLKDEMDKLKKSPNYMTVPAAMQIFQFCNLRIILFFCFRYCFLLLRYLLFYRNIFPWSCSRPTPPHLLFRDWKSDYTNAGY